MSEGDQQQEGRREDSSLSLLITWNFLAFPQLVHKASHRGADFPILQPCPVLIPDFYRGLNMGKAPGKVLPRVPYQILSSPETGAIINYSQFPGELAEA